MFVVCLNEFLASQSDLKYNSSSEIEYCSLDSFLRTPPLKKALVIFDEIDQMIGKESLQMLPGYFGDYKLRYVPASFQEWRSVIAFSGTISDDILKQFKTDFTGALTFKFPSLR